MSVKTFKIGVSFLIDLYDSYEYLKKELTEELGNSPFKGICENIISDALLYTFHGDQSTGERIIEKRLIRHNVEKIRAILITRGLFDSLHDALSISGQKDLVDHYEYHYDPELMSLMVRGLKTKAGNFFHKSLEDSIHETEELIDNGGYVPDRIRRAIHEYRT
jgi:hypothetical protein